MNTYNTRYRPTTPPRKNTTGNKTPRNKTSKKANTVKIQNATITHERTTSHKPPALKRMQIWVVGHAKTSRKMELKQKQTVLKSNYNHAQFTSSSHAKLKRWELFSAWAEKVYYRSTNVFSESSNVFPESINVFPRAEMFFPRAEMFFPNRHLQVV